MDEQEMRLPVDGQRLLEFDRLLGKYRAGKKKLEARVVAAENWWKLRNEAESAKQKGIGWDDSFRAKSAWLHNVIVSKHADAMENYPEPLVLPREPGDRRQAAVLSAVLPVVLEQADFEAVYDANMWQKLKTGTAVYKIVWDGDKQNGLGDIDIQRVDLLSVFWEPGITDIQKSRAVFHVEMQDNEVLESLYPQLRGRLGGQKLTLTRFLYDDAVSTEGKSPVVDVYYKRREGGRTVLHYCKYVNDTVLASTENDEARRLIRAAGREAVEEELRSHGIETEPQDEPAAPGLYDHGRYPFVFDPLWPIEGSPCGYGYVDISMNPQIQLDLLDTAFLKNAMNGANPRYFRRAGSSVNEEQFKDVNQAFVDVSGSLDDTGIRPIDYNPLAGNYLGFYQNKVAELRQTSGNTESSAGISAGGVTAASAIAALQEASGKTSRDAVRSSYRAVREITEMLIELVRQFYTLPRQFRIVGESGGMQFESLDNRGLRPQSIPLGGEAMGLRVPVFDVKIRVQRRNAYTRASQNELALQLYGLGFFDPRAAVPALGCLEMMDFDGRDELMQRIAENGSLQDKLSQMTGIARALVRRYEPERAEELEQVAGGPSPSLRDTSPRRGGRQEHTPKAGGESGFMRRARERSGKTTMV